MKLKLETALQTLGRWLRLPAVWVPALVFGAACWLFIFWMPVLVTQDRSMGRTLPPGSFVLLLRTTDWWPPRKGELVVCKVPPFLLDYLRRSPKFVEKYKGKPLPFSLLTKRIAGEPGEEVEWQGKRRTLAAGQYWLRGDNSRQSVDSRFFGPVTQETILGRALVVYRSGESSHD